MKLLEVKRLITAFPGPQGTLYPVVDDVSFELESGETVGLVGESGSGKTMTALSILNLVAPPGKITSGKVLFEGRDLLQLGKKEMRQIRGKDIAMIFQEPMSALNPVLPIGKQLIEVVRAHTSCSPAEAHGRSVELLERVGMTMAAKRMASYPHQLSGGMKQRVVIAMALMCSPRLLLADEPTTALDVTIQAQVLEILEALEASIHISMLLITHDLSLIAGMARRVLIMYAGQIVETGPVGSIYAEPLHPYTRGLLKAVPDVRRRGPMHFIPGDLPDIWDMPGGCRFSPRCERVERTCRETPPALEPVGPGRMLRCPVVGREAAAAGKSEIAAR